MKILLLLLLLPFNADVEKIAISRPAQSKNNIQVGNYLESELTKLGLQVVRQKFSTGTNIIGVQYGNGGKKPDVIIIGCHYDSVRKTPGADDNASGCAMTLALARSLSKKRLNHTIKYIFFDNEENGMYGSRYYANNMKDKCIFMVNFDMVGHLRIKSSVPPDTVFPGLFKKYPWAKQVSFRQGAGPSDHAPFQRKGIPFVWIFTGSHNKYHKPSDKPNTLNYKGMELIEEYARDLILGVDGKKFDYNILWSLDTLEESH